MISHALTPAPQLFAEVARRHGDRPAFEVPPGLEGGARQVLTYRQVEHRARCVGRMLTPHVQSECIVPVILGRASLDLLPAQIGCWYAGAAHACLDPKLPDERLQFMLQDTGAGLVLTDAAHAGRVRSLCSGRNVEVCVLGDWSREEVPALETPPWFSMATLAYVIYTSGTTGRPKGVLIEHKSLANLIHSDIDYFSLKPGVRAAQVSSPSYDSSVEEIWLALAAGGVVVVMDEDVMRLGPDLVPWLARERIEVFCPPPTILRAMGCTDPGPELPDLKLLYVGGEALDQDLARIWGGPFWLENGYGPTETTVTAVRCRVAPDEPVLIGHAVRGTFVHVLNEDGHRVPSGTLGELCLGGAGLARGYLNRPEETERRFRLHPEYGRLYHTGDLVREEAGGALSFHGRMDAQVKIRGHRIELEEIEAHIARLAEVREAACRIQGSRGREMVAAWIVPQPECSLTLKSLRRHLEESLPPHMIPARMGVLESLPRTVGGKLARKHLPEVAETHEMPGSLKNTGGRSEEEQLVETAMCAVLDRQGPLDVGANFFDELEGDSLRAAMLVSKLRQGAHGHSITVKDVYQNPTIEKLALCLNRDPRNDSENPAFKREGGPRPSPWPVGLAQLAVLCALMAASAPLVWLGIYRILPFLLKTVDLTWLVLALPPLLFVLAFLLLPLYVLLVVATKRLLIGRCQPGRTPVYSWYYFRHWLVQQMVQLMPWRLLAGTVLQNHILRLLGARIGERVHIHRGVNLMEGGWDLLDIGDDVTLGQDASVRLVDYDDGHLVFAPVVLKNGVTLTTRSGVNPGVTMEEGSMLAPLSVVTGGVTVPAGELWSGVPAGKVGNTAAPERPRHPASMTPLQHALGSILLGLSFDLLFALPGLALLLFLLDYWNIRGLDVLHWIENPWLTPFMVGVVTGLALVAPPLGLLLQALFCRVLGRLPTGCISRWSFAYMLVWLKSGVVSAANNWLSGTLYWPLWLRLAGMKIGRNSELSTIIDVVPEHLSVGDESFFADGIYPGGPLVHRGCVHLRRTHIGSRVFLGNHAVIEAGVFVPDDVLLGICTVSHEDLAPGTSWFGLPPFPLPRREVVDMPRQLTHEPGLFLFAQRLSWETLRFALPLLPLALATTWLFIIGDSVSQGLGQFALWGRIALLNGALALAMCSAVLALKWLLLGRTRPGQHGFWSGWCCRWDFLYVAWGAWARPILSALEGTPFLHFYLRAMGVRIGRNVILGQGFAQVVDPDMIVIEDGATVNGLFQAHSFEDRVLKMDTVHIGPNAGVHDGAVLMYGAHLGARCCILHHSVVMKQEHMLPGRCYQGAPSQPV